MAESKSAEFASKINESSEFSSSVHPLTPLANFPSSECGEHERRRKWGTGSATAAIAVPTLKSIEQTRSLPE